MQKLIKTKHNIEILLQSEVWSQKVSKYKTLIHRVLNLSLNSINSSMPVVEISVVLGDDEFIRQLNRDYRMQDKPTNVLSFPFSSQGKFDIPNHPQLLGDIILAFETISTEALQQNKTFTDHMIHLLVHGVLHLLGYDHENDQEAEEMEAREIAILAQFNITNPYNDRT